MEKVALIVGVAISLVVGPQRAAEIVMNDEQHHIVAEQISPAEQEL